MRVSTCSGQRAMTDVFLNFHHLIFETLSQIVSPICRGQSCDPAPFPPLALGLQEHTTTHPAGHSTPSPHACESPPQPPSAHTSKHFITIGKYLPMTNFSPINVKPSYI